MTVKQQRRKTNNKPRDASTAHGSTAAESVRNLIKKNPKYSKRINYNALKELFTDEGPSFQLPGADDDKDDDFVMGKDDPDDDDFSDDGDDDAPARTQSKKGKGKGKAKTAGKGKKKASIPSTPVRDTPQFDGVNPRVMLISLKAGALGLNLTVANNVYL